MKKMKDERMRPVSPGTKRGHSPDDNLIGASGRSRALCRVQDAYFYSSKISANTVSEYRPLGPAVKRFIIIIGAHLVNFPQETLERLHGLFPQIAGVLSFKGCHGMPEFFTHRIIDDYVPELMLFERRHETTPFLS